MKLRISFPGILALLLIHFAAPRAAAQEIVSRTLTDAIYQGDGVIDLLKDISAGNLATYFNESGGFLMLGADVNENNSGNENNDSLGVAIKQVQLNISTTDGDFTFGDFFTSTTALLRESGSTTAQEYYTLFGQGGSNSLTGAAQFDLSSYDDVLWLENIVFTGEILSASLQITLLKTPSAKATASEEFFDFSGGFEDFALLAAADAVLLENANIGMDAVAADVGFGSTTTVTESLTSNSVSTTTTTPPPPVSVPAAPAPPWKAVLALAGIVLIRLRRDTHHAGS